MALNFFKIHSLCRVTVQDLSDEICHLSTQIYWKFNVDLQYFVIGLIFINFALERSSSRAQLIAKNTKAPDINSLIIKISSHDFGWNIVKSSTKSLSLTK